MPAFATRLPKVLFAATVSLLLTQLAVLPAQSQTRITSCGTTITSSGDYILANNLTCPRDGITIRSNNVNLRLDGHNLNGSSGSSTGIAAINVGDVHISGPGAIGGFGTGVSISGPVAPVEVQGVLAEGNVVGIRIGGQRHDIHDNRAEDNDQYGIATESGSANNRIHNNRANSNGNFDLFEGNSTCTNDWHDNSFGSANESCIH